MTKVYSEADYTQIIEKFIASPSNKGSCADLTIAISWLAKKVRVQEKITEDFRLDKREVNALKEKINEGEARWKDLHGEPIG